MPSHATYRDAYLVDWRFLLPELPGGLDHLLLAGGTRDHEEAAVRLGVARRVSRIPRPNDPADVVVVLADSGADAAMLARHLAPDGVIYWEVDRRVRGAYGLTPARAFDRLRGNGVVPAAGYWVKPGFPDRHMYLPLDAPGTFRWYVDSLFGSRTRARRILKTAARAFLACEGPLSACTPCYAVVGARRTPRPVALLEAARARGACGAGPLHPVVLAHGGAPWNRLAMLLFEPGSRIPIAVLKSSRTTTFNAEVQWEHHVLRELASTLSPALRRSIPTSTFFHWNDLAVAVESCVTGPSLSSRIGASRNAVVEDLRLAVEWLAAFHVETVCERVPAREWLTRHLVNGICADYAASFRVTAAESRLFSTVARSLERCARLTLPLGWQHTDFVPWNVYRENEDVRVIDWEVARFGPGVADLLHFLIHWDANLHGHEHEAPHVKRVLAYLSGASEFPLGPATRRIVDAYLRRAGVDAALLPFLLVYTLAEQAVERGRRLRGAQQIGTLDPETIPYVAYLRAMGEQADQLFASEERHAA